MGEKELLSLQLGTQSVFATAVTGTVKLMGVTDATLTPVVKTMRGSHLRGSRAPAYTAVVVAQDGKGKFTEELSFEDAPYGLDGLFGAATPSGAGPYVRDWLAPLGSALTPKIFTAIYGDADGVYKLTGALISKAVYKISSAGIWTGQYDLVGKDVTTGSLAALSDRAVNLITGADTALYIDAWAGTIGTTAVDATAYSIEITIDAKRAIKHYLNGSALPGGYKQPGWDVSMKLHLEFNATSKAYLDAILSSTAGAPFQRQIRALATRDSSTTLKTLQFDFAGAHDGADMDVYTDEDGVNCVDLNMAAVYNTTLGNYLKVQSKNSVSSLA